jgi:hypothetical protein
LIALRTSLAVFISHILLMEEFSGGDCCFL